MLLCSYSLVNSEKALPKFHLFVFLHKGAFYLAAGIFNNEEYAMRVFHKDRNDNIFIVCGNNAFDFEELSQKNRFEVEFVKKTGL
jgi:hypothetical protein